MSEVMKQGVPAGENMALRSAWPSALASVAFSWSAFAMASLYGVVHNNIMLQEGKPCAEPLYSHALELLGKLHNLRVVFAAFAIAWAFWSFKGRPRLIAVVALGLSIAAALSTLLIV